MSIRDSPSLQANQLRSRAGPLALAVDDFAQRLATEGYAECSIRHKLATVADLGGWLRQQGHSTEDLSEPLVEKFLGFLHSRRKPQRLDAPTCRQLLDLLRAGGHVPAPAPQPADDSPIDCVARQYEDFLLAERGLRPTTAVNYGTVVRSCLRHRFGDGPVDLGRLTVRDANRFVMHEAQRLSQSRCKLVVTALRSFLRRLHQCGDTAEDLSRGILPVTQRRLSDLPQGPSPEQVEALLASCSPDSPVGRRDRAILLLLARLGLRAGEVAALTLDDFDWQNGTVSVCGRPGRRETLPLPQEAGAAVAEYLQAGRPECAGRHLFVRAQAPRRDPLSVGAVSCIVRRAAQRAGLDNLPSMGARQLRHHFATGMLRDGASLEDIGLMLRHRHPDTTRIYAKVDLEALRTVAPAWPGSAA